MFHRIHGMKPCPSCCVDCAVQPPARRSASPEPHALANLLPAGTIHLSLLPNESLLPSECPCDHRHADDGWHILHTQMMLRQLATPEDDSLLRELEFLVKHLFISCTCRLGPLGDTLYVRIYVIPYDLANMHGRLRVRDEATILAPARRYLRRLFQGIIQDKNLWEGDDTFSSDIRRSFISHRIDNRTIAEIYSDLPSPCISSDYPVSEIAHRLLEGEEVDGLRSSLYTYQRRTVVAMIQKETCPSDIPDPLFISIVGIDGREFYLQPSTMEILQERPIVQQNRGGVLCEELGTGKTVMILALVLATIDQLPSPEESILDIRPVMTPLAFRTFPSADFIAARKRATRRPDQNHMLPGPKVPSLVEILLHCIRTSPESLGVRYYKEALEARNLLHVLQHNTPFYHHHDAELVENQRSRRQKPHPGPRLVYLSTASLIVVPPNLVAQWNSEILKHCRSVLRVLVLKNKAELPRAKVLASDYDIVLMSHSRFAAEANKCDVTNLHSWKICQCPEFNGTRIPDCHCNGPPDVSPLLQIRWKRLVVDEGHVAAATSTNLTELAKVLNVERRWLVTGTPTTNLLGLSFGRNTEQSEAIEELPLPPSSPFSDSSPSIPPSNIDDTENHTEVARRWTKADREDLNKLAVMMTHFLKVPHFAANPKVLHHVITPLLDPEGPRPGGIQVLVQVMNMVMIRHQIEDVEKDVILPAVKQEVILMDLDPLALMSYNAFQAGIALNAIDSERKDQDYIFHPRNTIYLLQAMGNLSQIMFWSVSDDLYNVDQLFQNKEHNIKAAEGRNVHESDLALLNASYDHITRAAQDNLWRAIHEHEDVPYRVSNMPRSLFEPWTRMELKSSQPSLTQSADDALHVVLMHPDRLIKMRDMVFNRPLVPSEVMIQSGIKIDAEDFKRRRLYLEHRAGLNKNKRDKDVVSKGILSIQPVKKVVALDKMEEVRRELFTVQERQKALAYADDRPVVTSPETTTFASASSSGEDSMKAGLLASSPLADVRIGQSASSKLNYILNEVLQYSGQEKFLIFSQSALTLAHVAEGLELIKIKALQFTTQVSPHEREQLVMTFETSETYRVLLMELKHGARGLNLIAASRVIFCEPVWQADVESQAIKRAHRIGQTRPISVKTLAIRSTVEETMINRREALKGRPGKCRNMTDEEGMRSYIANPAFLEKSDLVPTLDFALLNRQLRKESDSEGATVSVTHDIVASHPEDSMEPPLKKRKGVRFMDEDM